MSGIRKRSSIGGGLSSEPTPEEVFAQADRRPTTADIGAASNQKLKTANNKGLTGASALTVKQSIFPCLLVTILFFLWGIGYGLLDTLNAKFQSDLNITAAKAGGLQASYFGAYFLGPLTWAGWIVRRFGFRWTFISGLVIFGVGCLMFWPSAHYGSFGGFCGSLFIAGGGLSTLETSADPYLSICGPPRLSEFRLEAAQGVQAIGSVVAPLIASKAFFAADNGDLTNVQWTYLAIACFVFLLSIVFFFAPIPEVTDADMELQAAQSSDLTGFQDKPIWKQDKLLFAVAAQFCYVGAQVGVAANFISYAKNVAGVATADASNRYAIAQGVFAAGRFASAGATLYMKPRLILVISASAILLFIALSMGIKGEAGLAMLTVVLFFESNQFPLILTLGIRGLGRHTKLGSSWIVAAISGGAFFPAMTGLAADRWGYNRAMFVPLIGFLVSWAFSIYLNTVSAAELDGHRATMIGYTDKDGVIGDLQREKRVSVTNIEMDPMKKGSVGTHREL